MIPPREQLEPFYEKGELELFDKWRPQLADVQNREVRNEYGRQFLRKLWPDEREHIEKTHWITVKDPARRSSMICLLQFNYVQVAFYDQVWLPARMEHRPLRVIVLKARQLGCSTLVQSLFYEQLDRDRYRNSITVSYDDSSTEDLFRKASFIDQNLWFARTKGRDRSNVIDLKAPRLHDHDKQQEWSSFSARTSGNLSLGRGSTLQFVHASEVPMWADPDEALTSLQQAVPTSPGTAIIWESTARGTVGPFYEGWRDAVAGTSDYVPFFAPWFWDPDYALVFQDQDRRAAFGRSLVGKEQRLVERFKLTLDQLHWRRWCIRNNCNGSERKFEQEYPATPEEAFLTTGTPVFDGEALTTLEHNAAMHRPYWTGEIALES